MLTRNVILFPTTQPFVSGTDLADWMVQELFDSGSDTAVNRIGIQPTEQPTHGLIPRKMGTMYPEQTPDIWPVSACPTGLARDTCVPAVVADQGSVAIVPGDSLDVPASSSSRKIQTEHHVGRS
jgi:hypothetical protein